jgi:hypothetical protein
VLQIHFWTKKCSEEISKSDLRFTLVKQASYFTNMSWNYITDNKIYRNPATSSIDNIFRGIKTNFKLCPNCIHLKHTTRNTFQYIFVNTDLDSRYPCLIMCIVFLLNKMPFHISITDFVLWHVPIQINLKTMNPVVV